MVARSLLILLALLAFPQIRADTSLVGVHTVSEPAEESHPQVYSGPIAWSMKQGQVWALNSDSNSVLEISTEGTVLARHELPDKVDRLPFNADRILSHESHLWIVDREQKLFFHWRTKVGNRLESNLLIDQITLTDSGFLLTDFVTGGIFEYNPKTSVLTTLLEKSPIRPKCFKGGLCAGLHGSAHGQLELLQFANGAFQSAALIEDYNLRWNPRLLDFNAEGFVLGFYKETMAGIKRQQVRFYSPKGEHIRTVENLEMAPSWSMEPLAIQKSGTMYLPRFSASSGDHSLKFSALKMQ